MLDLGEYRWQRALLSIGDYLLRKGRNVSFLGNSATDEASWKRLLRGTRGRISNKREILRQLWDLLSPDDDLSIQLDDIIDASKQIGPWLESIVHCPEAIEYCENNYIRIEDFETIYLLKRAQMNGYHAELFTYCLYKKLRKRNNDFSVLCFSYNQVTDTYSEPCLLMEYDYQDDEVRFDIYYQNGEYRIKIAKTECEKIANFDETLKKAGFIEGNDLFQIKSSRSDIEKLLNELDRALFTEFNDEADHD